MPGQKDEFPGSAQALTGPYHRWATITPGAGALVERPRAIHNSGTAGTITMTDEAGASIAIYFAQGATLAVRPTHITAAAGGVVVIALF